MPKPDYVYPLKQVIAVRMDLSMPPGKLAAQVAHASSICLIDNFQGQRKYVNDMRIEHCWRILDWIAFGIKKVVVQCRDLDHLRKLEEKAQSLGIIQHTITDSGHTVFDGVPTVTCIAIGPDFNDRVDLVTGGLPLL